MIHAFAEALDGANIFQEKWDIKDGFCRIDFKEVEEWNLHKPGMQIKLVVPKSLQMGWIESLPYFCTVSGTGRDVVEQYIETPVGSLA